MPATINITVYAKNDKKPTGNFYPLYPSSNKDLLEDEGIPFKELVIVKGNEKYFLFGVTDFRKPTFKIKGTGGEADTIESGTNPPVCLQIRHTKGKAYNYGTKQMEDEEPSELDSHICDLIVQKDLASDSEFLHGENLKVWACRLIMDGSKPELIKNSGFVYLEKCEKNELPDLPTLEQINQSGGNNSNGSSANGKSGNGKGSSYTPPPSTYDKLKDKSKFILENIPPEWNVKTLMDYAILFDADLGTEVQSQNGKGIGGISDKAIQQKIVQKYHDLVLQLDPDSGKKG